jgi:hypothetical protein
MAAAAETMLAALLMALATQQIVDQRLVMTNESEQADDRPAVCLQARLAAVPAHRVLAVAAARAVPAAVAAAAHHPAHRHEAAAVIERSVEHN